MAVQEDIECTIWTCGKKPKSVEYSRGGGKIQSIVCMTPRQSFNITWIAKKPITAWCELLIVRTQKTVLAAMAYMDERHFSSQTINASRHKLCRLRVGNCRKPPNSNTLGTIRLEIRRIKPCNALLQFQKITIATRDQLHLEFIDDPKRGAKPYVTFEYHIILQSSQDSLSSRDFDMYWTSSSAHLLSLRPPFHSERHHHSESGISASGMDEGISRWTMQPLEEGSFNSFLDNKSSRDVAPIISPEQNTRLSRSNNSNMRERYKRILAQRRLKTYLDTPRADVGCADDIPEMDREQRDLERRKIRKKIISLSSKGSDKLRAHHRTHCTVETERRDLGGDLTYRMNRLNRRRGEIIRRLEGFLRQITSPKSQH
ncbi:hypothetical protein K439DRAFT_1632340 [Ramaria rubella]|nr:hypothetical protein K439DRAFT_1632340 [Ramaria rubella]